MDHSRKDGEEHFHKNLKNWKFSGLFYYCNEDKRLFVDKLNPTYGTTLNFAHPKSYLILLLCFLFFGFVVYMITKNH